MGRDRAENTSLLAMPLRLMLGCGWILGLSINQHEYLCRCLLVYDGEVGKTERRKDKRRRRSIRRRRKEQGLPRHQSVKPLHSLPAPSSR